ncbi:hypothetical protein LINGRAPRIM_LOCUS3003 [Linum grandiflorum]
MATKPPDPACGLRRPSPASSSPTAKGDRDTQHAKNKVWAMDLNQEAGLGDVEIEDVTHKEQTKGDNSETLDSTMKLVQPNAWTERTNTLFEEFRCQDDWYVADSDSEDVAAEMREEDDEIDAEEDDP